MKNTLLIIDPQNDFVDPMGSLSVKGADLDMDRLATLITDNKDKIDDIIVTLDSHTYQQIFHPSFWVDRSGNPVKPFTQITLADFDNGVYHTTADEIIVRDYLVQLQERDKFPLIVWPYHCIIGTWGHCVYPELATALGVWERSTKRQVKYIFKGMDQYREMYSALKPEVIKVNDKMFNTEFGNQFFEALIGGRVIVAGEALSHCVANTVRDLVECYIDGTSVSKEMCGNVVIMQDACSNVTGYEFLGEQFLAEMKDKGVDICNSNKVFA